MDSATTALTLPLAVVCETWLLAVCVSDFANCYIFSGFGTRPSFSSCNVVFGSGGGGPTKRSIGQFNGWDVISKILSLSTSPF